MHAPGISQHYQKPAVFSHFFPLPFSFQRVNIIDSLTPSLFLEKSAALRNVPMIVIWDGTSGRSLPEWELSKDVQCMIAVGFHCFVVLLFVYFFS